MINNLTVEEEDLLASYERGEWQSINNLQEEMNSYSQAATAWMKEHHTISLTLPEHEFERFQQKVTSLGSSSQTVLMNLIHQFITQ